MTYLDGVLDGPFLERYEDGSKETEGRLDHGLKDGLWTDYYPGGAKKREVQYRQGLETGIATDFFPNGQKQQEISFVNGVEHGPWTEWHDNGVKAAQGTYDGRRTLEPRGITVPMAVGPYARWYPNGRLEQRGDYVAGRKEGTWTRFYDNGTEAETALYHLDGIQGFLFSFSPSGRKVAEESYRDGLKDGLSTYWNDQGEVTRIEEWRNGEYVALRKAPGGRV